VTPGADANATNQRSTGDSPAGAGLDKRRPSPAAETQRLYQGDWRAFVAWCDATGLPALPADPATLASFLAAAAAKLSAGALARRAAAIGEKHRARGFASPAADAVVKTILRESRHAATARRRRPAPDAKTLTRLAAACPGDLAGRRDRALLLLAAAGLGRAALVGLDVEHVFIRAPGLHLRVAGGGPDGDADVRSIAVARTGGPGTCAVQALDDWLRLSDTLFGPVFRKIDRWGNVEQHRLGTDAIRRILARRAMRRPRRRKAGTT